MSSFFTSYDNLSPGAVAFGRYRILRYLGRGSTSVVYACSLVENPDLVAALKVLTETAANDQRLVARFRNEVRVCNRLNHPNIIRSIEFLQNSHCEAYTMELVEGGNLHDLIYHQGALEVSECIRLLCQLCSGVQAIHDCGIVHRDLKPRNILMTLRREVKISDFTTALSLDSGRLPYDVGAVGTFEYMSPEVLKKGRADPRSDVFGIGVIAYQMITGQLPFQSTKFVDQVELKRRGRAQPPHRLRSDCPKPLSRLVMKALMDKPSRRFQTAKEMELALKENAKKKRRAVSWGMFGG